MNSDQIFNAGLKRARAGDYHGALISLRLAASLGDESAELFRLMGKTHVHLGELKQAEDTFRHALAIDPRDSAAALCLDRLCRLRIIRRTAALAAALAVAAAIFLALWFSWRAYRRLDVAVAAISARSAANPAAVARAELPATAAPRMETLPQRPPPLVATPSFESRYREAVGTALKGDLRRALPLLRALSGEEYANQPLAGNVHFWMGRCLYELGQTREALEHFQRVLERYPGSRKYGEASIDAARCRRKLGESYQRR